MPAQTKYNPAYHDDWAWSLAIKGATNDEIAEAFDISVRTFIRWCQTYESLAKCVEEGKNIADARVEKSLYERTQEHTVTEEEKILDFDKDGNPKPVRVKTVKKVIPADTMSIMYWLNNRKRGSWSQRQEVSLTASDEQEDVIIYLPANGRDTDE